MSEVIALMEFGIIIMIVLILAMFVIYFVLVSKKNKKVNGESVIKENDYDYNKEEGQEYVDLDNNDPINYYDDEKTDL